MTKPCELSFKEIAEFEFNIHYPDGEVLLKNGYFNFELEAYKVGSFIIHQACERFYNAVSLVFTNYRPKSHKLNELGAGAKEFSRDLVSIFPQNTDFEKRCFDLLCRAYIEARYNKDFVITREELTYMLERTEILKAFTLSICTEKIASYDMLIESNGGRGFISK